jgi:hypothetical protein
MYVDVSDDNQSKGIKGFTEEQVLELTDWDAEKYRQGISMMVIWTFQIYG